MKNFAVQFFQSFYKAAHKSPFKHTAENMSYKKAQVSPPIYVEYATIYVRYLYIKLFILICRLFITLVSPAVTFTVALLSVRTAYTFFPALFCSVKVQSCTSCNKQKNYHQNYICNHYTLMLVLFETAELKAYSSLSFLFVLLIRPTTNKAKAATITRPLIAAPTLSEAGALISVPIV